MLSVIVKRNFFLNFEKGVKSSKYIKTGRLY